MAGVIALGMIGDYNQLSDFTNENAGTSEWCKAEKGGRLYFIKKFQSPVYPSKELGLPETKYAAKVKRFHKAKTTRETMYAALRKCNTSGALVIPEEVMSFQFHLCTVTEYVTGNIQPVDVCRLSEWQRIILMRTLLLAVMNVHAAGIVHADIKDENILITQNAETGACLLKLIDFDSSYMRCSPPQTADDLVGDMAYWAPEVYAMFTREGIILNEKTDVFAVGLLLHFLWTGKLPDSGAKDKEIGRSILSGDPVMLESSMPPVLKKLISGLIAAKPEDRIPLEDAYAALAIQLDKYPHTIVKLVEPPPLEPIMIPVVYFDDKGKVIEKTAISVVPGTSVVVNAKEIDGYRLVSAEKIHVEVSRAGIANIGSVQFTYHKKTSFFGWLMIAIAVAIAAWILLNSDISWPWGGDSNHGGVSSTPIPSHKPLNLYADPQSNGVLLTWDNQSNATYNLTRESSNGSGGSSRIIYSNRYLDTDVIPGEHYRYEVVAYVDGHKVRDDSTEIIIDRPPTATPVPTHKPLNARPIAVSNDYIHIRWDNQDNTVYIVERRLKGTRDWVTICQNNGTFYVDRDILISGKEYEYSVTAYIGNEWAGTSSFSVTAPTSTPAPTRVTPTPKRTQTRTPKPTQGRVTPSPDRSVIGKRCEVSVDSGWTRYGAGISYGQYDTVVRGQRFIIYDVVFCTDGSSEKFWYKINLENQWCWISSGLVRLID